MEWLLFSALSLLNLDDDTIRGWHKTYLQDGWDALAFDGWKGSQSRMTQAQEAALCAWLETRFCRSTVEIRAHVAAECGLNYSHSGCIKLLARLGFEYRGRVTCIRQRLSDLFYQKVIQ